MGRPCRQLDPIGFHHVVSRGNNGGRIVRDAIDRVGFRHRLNQIALDFEWELCAWCLMTTHFHGVLRAPEGAISAGMQKLIGNHARATNRRHGRTGHLFQNRFFSVEVATDAHLVSSTAYVNRNPFAALAVEAPEDWRDSSYRALLGLEPAPAWLAVEFVLGVFGPTPEQGRAALSDLVRMGRVPVSDTIDAVRRYETRGVLPDALAVLATSG